MEVTIEELRPESWPQFEKLFAPNGACGGCWFMWWRIAEGERWPQVKGEKAKRRMKSLVRSGKAKGLLAFVDGQPVGWMAIGPRMEFSRLQRARTLACDDPERVWSLPCFYVKSGFRSRGVANSLLRRAVELLRARGAKILEAYPVAIEGRASRLPAAFAYTGTVPMFESAGFQPAATKPKGKQRYRRTL